MQVIDAAWERRNLGVSCQEVTIDVGDGYQQLKIVDQLDAEYQVIRSPVERPDFLFELSQRGFVFVEVFLSSVHYLRDYELSPQLARHISNFSFEMASHSEIDIIRDNIAMGVFKTDRVSIDPCFGIEKSAQRYLGWMADEIEKKSDIFALKFRDEVFGFSILKKDCDSCHAKLGAVFYEKRRPGLGMYLNYFNIIASINLGCSSLYAPFSSNNLPVFSMNQMLGFKIKPLYNILVKHVL